MNAFSSVGLLCKLIIFIVIVQNAGSLNCKQQSLLWHNHYRKIHQFAPFPSSFFRKDQALIFDSQTLLGSLFTVSELVKLLNVGNVTWSSVLFRKARAWAIHLADKNLFIHEKKDPGNLFLSAGQPKEPCARAVQLFYAEEKHYNYTTPEKFKGAGHFAQVVWKNTKYIGAFSKVRKDKKTVVVVKYSPPGNVRGYFAKNVFPPRKPTVTTPGPKPNIRAAAMNVKGWIGSHFVMQWLLVEILIR